uniref:C2H2-type domain-containing protein n=1 Tax=Caenorhabditis tropicalis TaxID=1561998 RepID=A0A1I7SYN0_9PELO
MEHHHIEDDIHVNSFLELKHPQPRYLCPYGCQKLIAPRTIDYHKNNGCGRRTNDSSCAQPELKKRFYCCGSCLSEFVARSEFHAHLRVEHDVHPEIHNLEFADRQLFDRFKYWLESEGGAHFRHKSGAKRRGRGKGIFLACNRSGNTGPDKGNHAPERTGPFRLGFTCTAFIHATEHSDGRVSAEFCGDHYGHDARMRLPQVIKYIIAKKQIEQCPPMDIIGFLRHHFLNLASENIFAQRICFVDQDELKSIAVSCTKKWRSEGIPRNMEVWEEELLEKVGIEWPPSDIPHRFDEPRKLTTVEIAHQERWPRPRVFAAKNRREDGVLVPFDMPGAIRQSANHVEYEQEEDMVDDNQYMAMEMGEYEVDGYVQDGQIVVGEEEEVEDVVVAQEYQNHQEILNKQENILEEGDVEVEVENEVIVTTVVDTVDQVIDDQKCEADQIVLQSPSNEIVVVDGDVEEEEMNNHLHHHHHQHHQHPIHPHEQHHHQNQPGTSSVVDRYMDETKANTLDQVLEEIDAFKDTVLKRADHISPANLKSLLIRFQTLHQSVMDKEQIPGNQSMTVFPNRSKFLYRPGKGLEKTDEYHSRGTGDISLQPIDDEMSDDEELMMSTSSVMPYNAGIWS